MAPSASSETRSPLLPRSLYFTTRLRCGRATRRARPVLESGYHGSRRRFRSLAARWSPPMRLSCALVPRPGVAELASLAERLGYDRVWLADSPALYGDVWIAVAEAARATSRIGLGTSVLIPGLRHVAVTAAAIAHVEALAPGPPRVPFGTGFTVPRMLGKRALPRR